MYDRLIHLRIKIKSLVDESKNIRRESRKIETTKKKAKEKDLLTEEYARSLGSAKWKLDHHRTTVVRWHTRFNLLAYGLLRGIPYEVMEKKCNIPPNFKKITSTAKNFGGADREIVPWVNSAKEYLTVPGK